MYSRNNQESLQKCKNYIKNLKDYNLSNTWYDTNIDNS